MLSVLSTYYYGNVIMLCVFILNVIMLTVVAPVLADWGYCVLGVRSINNAGYPYQPVIVEMFSIFTIKKLALCHSDGVTVG